MTTQLGDILQTSGYRLTQPRTAVFTFLEQSSGPMTISAIARHCSNIDRTSVYRTIELFLKLHIIVTVPRGWKHAYELAEPFHPHHHHFQCTRCKKSTTLQSTVVEKMINELAQDLQATPTSHTFEIHGLCRDCR